MYKVLHINTYSLTRNRSFPHLKIHENLLNSGHRSHIISAYGDIHDQGISIIRTSREKWNVNRVLRKLLFDLRYGNSSNYFYPEWRLGNVRLSKVLRLLPFKPDVIMVYWTKFGFNMKLLYELGKICNAKVLLVPVDMAFFTGGCHFSGGCTNYIDRCGSCVLLNSKNSRDLSRRSWEIKNGYMANMDVALLLCSSTLYEQANRASLTARLKKHSMLLGVDEDLFFPDSKEEARVNLKIPLDKKIVFFGAANLTHPRKGMKYLIRALEILKKTKSRSVKDVFLLIAGNGLGDLELPFEYKNIGYLRTEEQLASAYKACDIFVCPSIEDSGPLMINQAIMSGRPVVSFNMGVAPDLVLNGTTGYLAKCGDSEELAYGLKSLLELSFLELDQYSRNCRDLGLTKFSKAVNTSQVNSILKKLLTD